MNIRLVIGLIFILLGITALTGINLGRFIGPAVLIVIGIIILSGRNYGFSKGKTSSTAQDSLNEVLVFSGTQKRVVSENFKGGKIAAIFGGADFDLTDAKIKEKTAELEVVAVFGGVQLKVPKNWIVKSEAVGILGGVDDKTKPEEKTVELHLRGAAIFGGIEVKN